MAKLICPMVRAQSTVKRQDRALLGHLARIGKENLRLPAVIADLPRHTDALAAEGGLGGPEFRAVLPIDDRGEDGVRIRLPEVKERRLPLRVELVFGGSRHTARPR